MLKIIIKKKKKQEKKIHLKKATDSTRWELDAHARAHASHARAPHAGAAVAPLDRRSLEGKQQDAGGQLTAGALKCTYTAVHAR